MDLAQSLQGLVQELDGAAEDLLRSEFGMTHSQLGFLSPLALHGELDVSSLAIRAGVSTAAVSKRIGWFEERGLIRAAHPAGESKRVVIRLTPKGTRLTLSAMARLADRLDEILGDWPQSRRTQLQRLASELAEKVRYSRNPGEGRES